MTRKDFKMFANVVNRYTKGGFQGKELTPYGQELVRHLVHEVSYELSLNNPRFDKGKFIDACYAGAKKT